MFGIALSAAVFALAACTPAEPPGFGEQCALTDTATADTAGLLADCPAGLTCAQYGQGSGICTWACSGNLDCPTGYVCLPPDFGDANVCLPHVFR